MRNVTICGERLRLGACVLGVLLTIGACSETVEQVESTSRDFTLSRTYWDGNCNAVGPTTCSARGPSNTPPTTSMHCCLPGYAMTGLYNASNQFKCSQIVPSGQTESQCTEYDGTWRVLDGSPQMRACPQGMYMKGLHSGQGKIICCSYPGGSGLGIARLDGKPNATTLDIAGFDDNCSLYHTVHVCQLPSAGNPTEVMVGVHLNNEDFICEH